MSLVWSVFPKAGVIGGGKRGKLREQRGSGRRFQGEFSRPRRLKTFNEGIRVKEAFLPPRRRDPSDPHQPSATSGSSPKTL